MPIFCIFIYIFIVQNYIFLAYAIIHPFLDIDLKNKFELFLSYLQLTLDLEQHGFELCRFYPFIHGFFSKYSIVL